MAERTKLGLLEKFGLSPVSKALKETMIVLKGKPGLPGSRFGLSSLTILDPGLGVRTWLGITRRDRLVPIYNLFNHTPTPIEDGWSVRVTQVRDFRGGTFTYDSHNGTDFAVPVGTTVVAAAPGKVVRVSQEFNRGGLKVFIDHGRGLMTTSNHLGRSLVEPGDIVERGQPVALSGASGLDMVVAFPWTAPHVHYNVWLNGDYVEPFAHENHISLWRGGGEPVPYKDEKLKEKYEPNEWDEDALDFALESFSDDEWRAEIEALDNIDLRAGSTLFYMNYFPTLFAHRPCLYKTKSKRESRLDLPFLASDFDGIYMPDDLGA